MIKIIDPRMPPYKLLHEEFKTIIQSKKLVLGKWTRKVENKIKELHGCEYAILTNSGTSAFMILLKAVESIFKFRNIEMQDFTWQSTKDIAEWLYPEKIKYVDIDEETWLMPQLNQITRLYKKKCKTLIIPNQTFGSIYDYNYPYAIYDSAHCIGMKECNGRGFGEILSFSPAKLATGCEGGAIITNNQIIYERALKLRRLHGRLSELNACVLFENLKTVRSEIKKRQKIYERYAEGLGFKLSFYGQEFNNHSHSEMAFRFLGDRDKFIKQLNNLCDTRIRYEPSSNLTNSNHVYNQIIILPATEGFNQEDIIKKIREIAI